MRASLRLVVFDRLEVPIVATLLYVNEKNMQLDYLRLHDLVTTVAKNNISPLSVIDVLITNKLDENGKLTKTGSTVTIEIKLMDKHSFNRMFHKKDEYFYLLMYTVDKTCHFLDYKITYKDVFIPNVIWLLNLEKQVEIFSFGNVIFLIAMQATFIICNKTRNYFLNKAV